jgi:hypothetical protein
MARTLSRRERSDEDADCGGADAGGREDIYLIGSRSQTINRPHSTASIRAAVAFLNFQERSFAYFLIAISCLKTVLVAELHSLRPLGSMRVSRL